MKIRKQFVSNSSSTSYLIVYDETKFKTCECCGHQPPTPLEVAEHDEGIYYSGEETYIKAWDYDECVAKIEENIKIYNRYNDETSYYEKLLKKVEDVELSPTTTMCWIDASYGSRTEEEIQNGIDKGVINWLN